MKHIEKIIISNARRFASNVEIDFGKGATIILAPNGTGKTTVFEAIELALTGEIKRLENFPDAIIRDGMLDMRTRLEFSKEKYCQVNYNKGGGITLSGIHDNLFSVESKSSLPYLFRLTHLLEQRGGEWFVEKKEGEAGDILRQLPIGKELGEIIKKKTSCLKEISARAKKAENDLDIAKETLLGFEGLLVKRNGYINEITLIPLSEIASKITLIGKLVKYEEFKEDYSVVKLNAYFEKIRVLLLQEYNTKKDLLVKLNVLTERVPIYVSNKELLIHIWERSTDHQNRITELTTILDTAINDFQSTIIRVGEIKKEIKELNSIKLKFDEIVQKGEQLETKKIELQRYKNEQSKLNSSHKITIEHLEKNERLRDQYNLINSEIENNKKLLLQNEQKNTYQKKWLDISRINRELIEKIIPDIEKKISDCLNEKSILDNKVTEAEEQHLMKRKALESLNLASSAIQEAVSSIRKHLTENQQECPVCNAKYKPGDLIKRIENSLNKINPEISIAIKEEKDALENLSLAKDIQNDKNQKLKNLLSEKAEKKHMIDLNNKEISERILPLFIDCRTPDAAKIQLEDQVSQINNKIKEFETNKSILEPQVSLEEIHNLYIKKQEEERLISVLATNIERLDREIKAENLEISNLNDILIGKDKEVIRKNLATLEEEETEKNRRIQKLEESIYISEKELKACQNSLSNENESASKIKGNQQGIYTEWLQAGLEGQPSEESLVINHENALKAIVALEQAIVELNYIEQDISCWRSAEKLHEVENMIKEQIGNYTEAIYLKQLENSVKMRNLELVNIKKNREAMNMLFDNIILENNQIHEQLNSINEPWKGLLKRIVINPLISAAPLLSNSTSRNKPIAKTFANIHKQNVDIAKIASEAQLSDIQLTLMLAMANKYQWTPWKGLLLDDPTQHHDLVHASSVFDVLRDYIINFDFQVMMSTHDPMQANFFHRKLENEGVQSKIYKLVSRKDGVIAERVM